MQFVMVKARDGVDPFLRRPFSLSAIEPDEGIIGITWDVIGRGTEIMAAGNPATKSWFWARWETGWTWRKYPGTC
jgi:NAD(P)H-flavin reductase